MIKQPGVARLALTEIVLEPLEVGLRKMIELRLNPISSIFSLI
jgi:hypothetical protein